MLRNHSGWAWRFVAFLFLLFLYGPTVRGAPLLGLPPIRPVIPSKPYTPSSYSISGYVYDDFSDQGVKLPGDAGLAAVQITLLQYASTGTQSFTTFTNSAGYYDFGNLTAGDSYNIQETQPTYFTTTADNLGYFQGASGGTLTVPPPASNGSPAPPNGFSGITFAPISTGVYSAVNYNFGESPTDFPLYGVPGKPYIPGGAAPGPSATFSTSLSLVGNNDRFLAGPGAGSLDLSATVSNTAAAGSGGLNWGTSPSSGAGFTPASYTNQAPGTALTLTGSVNGANLSSGTQNATLTVSGRIGSNGKLTSATASVLIDPVYSRGIDSVSTANLGRIMAGATTLPQTVTVTSAGAYLNYSNLTMNGGATAGTTDANGNYSVVNGAATTFDGTTTTNSGVAFSAQFASSLSGTISSTAAIPGNTGLFTGETLAAGTPALPTLNVPYTATVLQQRQLAPATGTSTSPLTVSTTGGGFLFGAVVPVSGYSVMSNTDSNHTTSVYVTGSANAIFGILAGDGVTVVPYSPATSIGQVFVTQQTLVNSAGVTSVPLAISLQNLGPYFGIAGLNVVTAEQASVKDPGGYAPVSFTYQVSNVGYAATGGSDSTGAQAFRRSALGDVPRRFEPRHVQSGLGRQQLVHGSDAHLAGGFRRHRRREFHDDRLQRHDADGPLQSHVERQGHGRQPVRHPRQHGAHDHRQREHVLAQSKRGGERLTGLVGDGETPAGSQVARQRRRRRCGHSQRHDLCHGDDLRRRHQQRLGGHFKADDHLRFLSRQAGHHGLRLRLGERGPDSRARGPGRNGCRRHADGFPGHRVCRSPGPDARRAAGRLGRKLGRRFGAGRSGNFVGDSQQRRRRVRRGARAVDVRAVGRRHRRPAPVSGPPKAIAAPNRPQRSGAMQSLSWSLQQAHAVCRLQITAHGVCLLH